MDNKAKVKRGQYARGDKIRNANDENALDQMWEGQNLESLGRRSVEESDRTESRNREVGCGNKTQNSSSSDVARSL